MFLLRFADQIAIGDEILVNKKDELVPTKVLKISSLLMKGTRIVFSSILFISICIC